MSASVQPSPLRAENFFHTGIVVANVDQAKVELGTALGLTWGLQAEVDMPTIFEGGPQTLHMCFAYSAQGPPYIELVQAVEGTLYAVPSAGGAHHVGYWCDDMEATAAALQEQGMKRVATVGVQSIEEHANWILFRSPSGLLIELVDHSLRAGFEAGEVPASND